MIDFYVSRTMFTSVFMNVLNVISFNFYTSSQKISPAINQLLSISNCRSVKEEPHENIYVKSTSTKFTWITWMNIYSRSTWIPFGYFP